MAISDELLNRAIDAIASVGSVEMDPRDLAQDVVLLSVAFEDEDAFKQAVASTRHALTQLAEGRLDVAPLQGKLSAWHSYHYQPFRAQGEKATLRIVYQRTAAGIRVRVFGHRHIPADVYRRSIGRHP